ncbi:hypothetical protein GGR57DRAFT_499932 [Xylariaceae sp. FL1272]|nr:hypothetical protein GGR57DRAFT_499932 [Xylariaceae sp. FL1272]
MDDYAKHPRRGPRRTVRDAPKKTNADTNAAKVRIHASGVQKSRGTSRTATNRKSKKVREKLKTNLIKKVDSRDQAEAYAEQLQLLNYTEPPSPNKSVSPTSPTSPTLGKKHKAKKREKKYMDDESEMAQRTENAEGRWIPPPVFRRRPVVRPESIPFGLWRAYELLDEHIYRQSLSQEGLEALPLESDVHSYEDEGEEPAPRLPEGFVWDDNRNPVPDDAYWRTRLWLSDF